MTIADQMSMHDFARMFLYGLPGGLERNADRDKFLRQAKLSAVAKGWSVQDVIENLLRAAYFQGRAAELAAHRD